MEQWNNETVIDMCDQELKIMLNKLVRDRRALARPEVLQQTKRVDQIQQKQENKKYYFQVEQPEKL